MKYTTKNGLELSLIAGVLGMCLGMIVTIFIVNPLTYKALGNGIFIGAVVCAVPFLVATAISSRSVKRKDET